MFTNTLRFVPLAIVGLSALSGQTTPPTAQAPAPALRDLCVKVQPGKGAEYAAMLHDISAAVAKVRVDAGSITWWLAERAVVPAGSAARCDYHLVSAYAGFPSEPLTPEQNDADLTKARINLTGGELAAKRNSLTTLVSLDMWRVQDGVGLPKKGDYIRHNYYRLKPGQSTAAWAKLEHEGWMPFAQALAKQDPATGWAALILFMPGGLDLRYNAMTVDILPRWAALSQGVPITTMWPKVHPDQPFNDYIERVNNTADRARIELFQVVEMVRPK